MNKSEARQNTTFFFEAEGDLDTFSNNIDKAISAGAKSLLLFSADWNNFDIERVNIKLKDISVPVFGGIFPQVIYRDKAYNRGSIVCGLDFAVQITNINGLSNADVNHEEQISSFADKIGNYSSMMILVDGNSRCISGLIEEVYGFFGNDVVYFGGGAGTLELKIKPCLFSNQGLLADSAQLIAIDREVLISVEHGWKKFAGPFVITESNHNVVKMVDYHPAFEAYKKAVEDDGIYKFKKDNFFDIAKNYPLGIEKFDGSFIVRDPVVVKDDSLICVGEVPENSVVYVLKGVEKELIAAAGKAANDLAQESQSPKQHYLAIMFDCISRSLILGKNFGKELNVINANLPSVIGASTIGEIANYGNFCLEFYNKTLVLALFKDE